jgi:hypothetical protein
MREDDNFLNLMKIDFGKLAEEHQAQARTEHLWALGARKQEDAEMHEQNADDHRMLAKWYKYLSDSPEFLADKLIGI